MSCGIGYRRCYRWCNGIYVRMCVIAVSRSSEGGEQTAVEDQVVKKLEQFNSVCDELYKEIVRILCGVTATYLHTSIEWHDD